MFVCFIGVMETQWRLCLGIVIIMSFYINYINSYTVDGSEIRLTTWDGAKPCKYWDRLTRGIYGFLNHRQYVSHTCWLAASDPTLSSPNISGT